MDENWLQTLTYTGAGFLPVMAFNQWRVAYLNYFEGMHPDNNNRLERHTQTDEVFVLLKGRGVLLIGGIEPVVDEIHTQVMEPGVVYNVRRNSWHSTLLSRDASVLIIEERETGDANSEFFSLPARLHDQVRMIARQEGL